MRIPLSRSGKTALDVMTQAAEEAGRLIMEHFKGEKHISYKPGRSNIVTDVDLLSEEGIVALLRDEFADFGVVTEESDGITSDSSFKWIIDPIDGTRNYAHGVPHFCVSVALAHGDEPVVGVVRDPVRGETFSVEGGKGAFLNGSPITVSKRTSLRASLVGFDMGYSEERGREMLQVANALWPGVEAVRVMGSAALGLCYTACGRLDLYINLSLSAWDLAAGMLLIREAGGLVTGPDGSASTISSNSIVAANQLIHREFMGRKQEGAAKRD